MNIRSTGIRDIYVQASSALGKGCIESSLRFERFILSTKAAEVQQVEKAVSGLPDIREAELHGLKNAVGQGTYKPSSHDIATAMFAEFERNAD